MFTPTVIELRWALDTVCRDPFLEDCDEPLEPSAPAVRGRSLGRSQRALVELALLRAPGRNERRGQRRAPARSEA
jgi:hypothetical protein